LSGSTSNILNDKSLFESFFKEQYGYLCRFAYGFLKDNDDAEEIVQGCFVKLWEDRKTLVIGDNPKPYLFSMVRNACLNQIKHIAVREDFKAHNEREINESATIEKEVDTHTLQEKVNQAIQNMPPQRKRIFEMSRFEGLKYKEIAAHLNISVKTVENHMGSAMKSLRVDLKDYMHLAIVVYFIDGLGDFVFSIVLTVAS
jgi:RNA polymerase sigma-70 factor (ECF subfamily)